MRILVAERGGEGQGENPSEVEGENRSHDVGIQEEAWRGQSG